MKNVYTAGHHCRGSLSLCWLEGGSSGRLHAATETAATDLQADLQPKRGLDYCRGVLARNCMGMGQVPRSTDFWTSCRTTSVLAGSSSLRCLLEHGCSSTTMV